MDHAQYNKSSNYYSNVRLDVLHMLPTGLDRVLEIGCGKGYSLRWLKTIAGYKWAAGAEIDIPAAQEAKRHVDLMLLGDIESLEIPIENDSLDAILCLDALEHLRDPWRMVERLVPLLKPGGKMLVSIPNVRHRSVVFPLLFFGRWDYQSAGILDATHLRFFTKRSAMALIATAGLTIDAIRGLGLEQGTKARLLDLATLGVLRPFLEVQYVILSHRPGTPMPL